MSTTVWFNENIRQIAVALATTATAHPDSTWVEGYHAGIATLLAALGINDITLPAPSQPRVVNSDWYELPGARFDDAGDIETWRRR